MRTLKLLTYVIFGLIASMSCSDLTDEDKSTIFEYLDTHHLKAIDTAGVYIVSSNFGGPTKPKENDIIEFTYKGYYTDGTIFDKPKSDEYVFLKLRSALSGLKLGLSKFGNLSEGTIIIPSTLGFGSNPPFGIRKNAILIYDVKVKEIK